MEDSFAKVGVIFEQFCQVSVNDFFLFPLDEDEVSQLLKASIINSFSHARLPKDWKSLLRAVKIKMSCFLCSQILRVQMFRVTYFGCNLQGRCAMQSQYRPR